MISDFFVYFFAATGTFFILLGNFGIVRLPDILCRSHALTKCATLGIGCLVLALGVSFKGELPLLKIVLIFVFQWITIPLSGHLLLYVIKKKGLVFPSLKK